MPSDAGAGVRHKQRTVVEAVAAVSSMGTIVTVTGNAEAEHLSLNTKHALSGAAETRGAQVDEHVPGQQDFDTPSKHGSTRAAEHGVEAALGGKRRGTDVGEAANCDI